MRLPLFVEMSGRKVLVIGGGDEGTKKTKRFLNNGANVKVLSLEFSGELKRLAKEGRIEIIEGDASNLHLLEPLIKESDFVVSSLADAKELDTMILNIANKYRKFVNLAGDAERTQIVMPIEARVNGLRIAITSEGMSTLTVMEAMQRVVKFLEQQHDIYDLLKVMNHLKYYMRSKGIPAKARIPIYRYVFKENRFRELIAKGDIEGATRFAESIVNKMMR